MNEFAKLLYELRKKKNLTQAELAKIVGVSNKTISKWETGETYPETAQLITLSNIFNITIDELLKGKIIEKNLPLPNINNTINNAVENDIKTQSISSPLTKKTAIQIIVEIILIFGNLTILISCMAFNVPYQIYVSIILASIALACSIFVDMSINKALTMLNLQFGKKYIHFISTGIFLTIFSPIIIICLHEFVSYGIYLPIFFVLLTCALSFLIYGEIMFDNYERELGIKSPQHSTNFFDSVSGIILLTATAIFILLGLMFNIWHPAWIIFPTSGIFITILNSFKHFK